MRLSLFAAVLFLSLLPPISLAQPTTVEGPTLELSFDEAGVDPETSVTPFESAEAFLVWKGDSASIAAVEFQIESPPGYTFLGIQSDQGVLSELNPEGTRVRIEFEPCLSVSGVAALARMSVVYLSGSVPSDEYICLSSPQLAGSAGERPTIRYCGQGQDECVTLRSVYPKHWSLYPGCARLNPSDSCYGTFGCTVMWGLCDGTVPNESRSWSALKARY